MNIEQIVEIPDSRRIYVDLPPQIPAGKARIAINIIEFSGTNDIEAFNNEEEASKFATRLSKRILHEAW